MRPRARRSGCCATLIRAPTASSTSPIPTTVARAASTTSSTSSSAPAWRCSPSCPTPWESARDFAGGAGECVGGGPRRAGARVRTCPPRVRGGPRRGYAGALAPLVSLPPGVADARRVGGGDINEAWRVTLADGRDAFVKTRPDAAAREYAQEARGLRWLAAPGALRTPRALEVAPDYLVLEWIEPGRLDDAGAEELGRGLALTHAAGAAHFGGLAFESAGLDPGGPEQHGRDAEEPTHDPEEPAH